MPPQNRARDLQRTIDITMQNWQNKFPQLFEEGISPYTTFNELLNRDRSNFRNYINSIRQLPEGPAKQKLLSPLEQSMANLPENDPYRKEINDVLQSLNPTGNKMGSEATQFAQRIGSLPKEGSSDGQVLTFQRFTPSQQSLMQRLGLLGERDIKDPRKAFSPIADQARSQFQEETIPGIAERFTGIGGGQQSSAFQQSLGQAGAGLERQLAALGAEFGQRQQQIGTGLAGLSLQPSIDTLYRPKQLSFGKQASLSAIPATLSALGTMGGAWLGGPTGGAAGKFAGDQTAEIIAQNS